MTREEAAREIDNTACCFSDKRFRDAMHMAAAALRDALRRQDGCDVCNHDGFDEMVCYIPTENGDGLMVMSNYCPNCGCEISKQAIKYGAGYVDQEILRSAT